MRAPQRVGERFGRPFWTQLWRSAGIQSAVLFAIASIFYGYQPPVGASAEDVALFYDGDRTRIFVAASLAALATLNLLWFAAALRADLSDEAQDGWGVAATNASAAFAALFLVFTATITSLAYSIADASHDAVTTGANDFAWSCLVLSSFPRAMLIMAGSIGLWRAKAMSNNLFALAVLAVVLVLAGGTTWASHGLWAPDGVFARIISPLIGLAWLTATSAVLLRRRATRQGW